MLYPVSDECINKQIIIDYDDQKATCVSFEQKGQRITKCKKILRGIK